MNLEMETTVAILSITVLISYIEDGITNKKTKNQMEKINAGISNFVNSNKKFEVFKGVTFFQNYAILIFVLCVLLLLALHEKLSNINDFIVVVMFTSILLVSVHSDNYNFASDWKKKKWNILLLLVFLIVFLFKYQSVLFLSLIVFLVYYRKILITLIIEVVYWLLVLVANVLVCLNPERPLKTISLFSKILPILWLILNWASK